MAQSLIFFLPLETSFLEKLILSFQEEFDHLLEDTFSDDELKSFATDLDALGAVFPGPLSSEISFEDFYSRPDQESEQRRFFETCKSSLSIENLPYLESSPFQVTYLQELLKKFEEVLIDRGGVSELIFKQHYLFELERFKNIDTLLSFRKPSPAPVSTFAPVDPIDFLVLDVYHELGRLKDKNLPLQELPEKLHKLIYEMKKGKVVPSTLYQKSGLNPKDFDDGLERLKFWLRKF